MVTYATIDSDNSLSPIRRQAIIWNNAGILLIGPLRTNLCEIWIKFKHVNISFQVNAFPRLVCEMVAIFARHQCVNWHSSDEHNLNEEFNIFSFLQQPQLKKMHFHRSRMISRQSKSLNKRLLWQSVVGDTSHLRGLFCIKNKRFVEHQMFAQPVYNARYLIYI